MPPYRKIGGGGGVIVLPLSVRLSVRLYVCLYEGISHQYASAGTKIKVICKGQGQI